MPLGMKGLTYFILLAKSSRSLENLNSEHFNDIKNAYVIDGKYLQLFVVEKLQKIKN